MKIFKCILDNPIRDIFQITGNQAEYVIIAELLTQYTLRDHSPPFDIEFMDLKIAFDT